MTGPTHLPLIAWSNQTLMNVLWDHENWVKRIKEELDRRGGRDECRHGFAIPVSVSPGVIETRYAIYRNAVEAYDAARERWPDDEAAPYRVHPVYLGKDD